VIGGWYIGMGALHGVVGVSDWWVVLGGGL